MSSFYWDQMWVGTPKMKSGYHRTTLISYPTLVINLYTFLKQALSITNNSYNNTNGILGPHLRTSIHAPINPCIDLFGDVLSLSP